MRKTSLTHHHRTASATAALLLPLPHKTNSKFQALRIFEITPEKSLVFGSGSQPGLGQATRPPKTTFSVRPTTPSHIHKLDEVPRYEPRLKLFYAGFQQHTHPGTSTAPGNPTLGENCVNLSITPNGGLHVSLPIPEKISSSLFLPKQIFSVRSLSLILCLCFSLPYS